MDHLVINDCKIAEVRQQDIKKNDEVVGQKTMVEIVTWGERFSVEVDPQYAESLKVNVVGRAIINGSLVSRAQVRNYDGRQYAATDVQFRFEKLAGFETGK